MAKVRLTPTMVLGAFLVSTLLALVACGPAATPTPSPTPTTTAGAVASPTPTPGGPPTGLRQVPRNRELRLIWSGREGRYVDHELWNPYAIGANHQNGPGIFYEPLYYYSAFADEEIPWLAESWEYSSDFRQLTYRLRPNITWSDGTPMTAEDIAFTFNSLRDLGSQVRWGVDVQQFLENAEVIDPQTVRFNFKVPAPKFHHFITYKFDIGVYPVPKHTFEGQDWTTFTHFDLSKGWPVTTSPWRVVAASPEQKVIDRVASCDQWWACREGFAELPKVERIIYLPWVGEVQTAQAIINNEVDASLDLRPTTMKTILDQNPNVTTHIGREKPYGYVDWWPISLLMNDSVEPFNDSRVRWAISYYINREQLIEVAYEGAGTISKLPWPSYPGLQPFTDELASLLERYPTDKYDPQQGDRLMQEAGFTKNRQGLWERNGQTVKCEVLGWAIFADIGPVVAQMLKNNGIDASFAQPPDVSERVDQGDFTCHLRGHGGSVTGDPYFTLRLYQSATTAVPGAHLVNFYRWKNDQFDQIVDRMALAPITDQAQLRDLTRQAMEIWLRELPDVQLVEWYHRIPMNTTYWKNWPTAENPYVNGAFWHLTFNLILNELEPAQ